MSMTRREAIRAATFGALAAVAALRSPRAVAQTDGTPLVPPAPPPTPPGPFSLGPLPYPPEALEPHIDAMTMSIHYGKHHAAYVNNLNRAISQYPHLAGRSLEDLLQNLDELPDDIRTAVRNNGGGHANHTLFWKTLSPSGGGLPGGALMEAIESQLGGFEAFKDALTRAALSVFGSGWAWLSLDSENRLVVESLPNQDSPLMFGRKPLFGIDVWEHAYYLKYQNRRAEYVAAVWNIVNWPAVEANYTESLSS
ncbi:MAG: superoxide dismutase [Kiritimatiellae bacterium]|nr:superoxide dismutase [Kiritimatiellia bacterium]MDW8459335.1 superoxide dismutase [Verrucomicrobiota bacterium]